ncbi:baseplate protein [Candidatus Woesearchaeota archaeon]|nr:baseplate protein [Candidatus Woesearchaeota archaeon]|tara:strand:+ start:769 stop:1482 length:714 start_codon:yes stop_codon:yes gene_type:complete
MALPKLQTPTYQLVLPSTNEKINYRPFLVREQKILLMAQESGKDEEIANAVSDLVSSCTFNKVDAQSSPLFDIEYVFLQIRSKSVGETTEVSVTCPDDKKTKVNVKLNLQDISVQMTANHSNEVQISDNVKMVFRYPLLGDMKGIIADGENNQMSMVFGILSKCISEIHHGDKVFNRVDINDKELEEFIDSMSTSQLESVIQFFDTMPKLRHVVKVTNPNTKVKSEVVVEGLSNFLV